MLGKSVIQKKKRVESKNMPQYFSFYTKLKYCHETTAMLLWTLRRVKISYFENIMK